MVKREIRPLREDDFAELMRLEEEVFGAAGEGELGAFVEGCWFTVKEDNLAARGAAAVAALVREAIGDRPAYLSFDIDAVDPAFAPGTGTPVPGGLASREALTLVRGLAGLRLVGMDLVEVCPALDHADLTCHLASHLLFEGLAIVATRFPARPGREDA